MSPMVSASQREEGNQPLNGRRSKRSNSRRAGNGGEKELSARTKENHGSRGIARLVTSSVQGHLYNFGCLFPVLSHPLWASVHSHLWSAWRRVEAWTMMYISSVDSVCLFLTIYMQTPPIRSRRHSAGSRKTSFDNAW